MLAGGRLLDVAPIDAIGGQDARTPIVRWQDDTGARHERRTTDPTALVRSTTTPMHALEVVRPSLEDVYLTMISEHAA